MPVTPPPPSPPPRPATSPPTSPQRHQQAMRHRERLLRDRLSPELRRVPSAPSVTSSTTRPSLPLSIPPQVSAPVPSSSTALPPPPLPSISQVSAPVTFNGRTFNHLPAHLAAALGNLQPFPAPLRRQRTSHPLSVSYLLFFSYSLSL